MTECLALRHTAQTHLISTNPKQSNPTLSDAHSGVIVFNTLPWKRSAVIVSPKRTSWVNQQYKDDYEYLLGKQNQNPEEKCIFKPLYLVENVPGLGASCHASCDFKQVAVENSVQGTKYLSQVQHFLLQPI